MSSQPDSTPTITNQVRSCIKRLPASGYTGSDKVLIPLLQDTLVHMERLAGEMEGHTSRVPSGQSSPEDLAIHFRRGVLESTRRIRDSLVETTRLVDEGNIGSTETKAVLGDMLRCLNELSARQKKEWGELKMALDESRQRRLGGEACES